MRWTVYIKIKVRTIDLNIKTKTINFLGEKIREHLHNLGVDKVLLNRAFKALIMTTNEKLNLIPTKKFPTKNILFEN